MKKQKKNQNLIIIIISITIFLLIYFVVSVVNFFKQPADTVLIKNGEIIKYEEVIGYIIRDEEIIDTSAYAGTPKANIDDATRVSKGTEIVTYMSSEEEKIKEKIEKLDVKIQEAMENKETIFSNDAKAIDSEIEIYLFSAIKENTDIYSLYEQKKIVNEKIEKKAKIVGDLSPVGSQLKTLINERASYEKQLNDSEKTVKNNKAGLVSYRIDNYENVLQPTSISKLTIEELKKIKIATNQIVPINTSNIKIVDNFECYIAVPMYSDESKNAKLNDNVYLRFSNIDEKLVNATVEYISEEEEGRLIVFKIKTNVEELTKYRKLDLDVVWWRDYGLKINKDALEYATRILVSGDKKIESGDELITLDEEKDIYIVTIKKSSYTQDALVKIVWEAGDFAIIENCKDAEIEKVLTKYSDVENQTSLKMYDEAIVDINKKKW